MFNRTLLVFAIMGLFHIASASPALNPAAHITSRASNEAIYLTNCDEFEPGRLFSEMDYYTNGKSGSQNQEHPDATAGITSNGDVVWEGTQVCGTFNTSGEVFCSNIVVNGFDLVGHSS